MKANPWAAVRRWLCRHGRHGEEQLRNVWVSDRLITIALLCRHCRRPVRP